MSDTNTDPVGPLLYTVGHSTLDQQHFLRILQNGEIDCLMDVRSHPGSRWPWFHLEQMRQWVPAAGIEYVWEPRLGGWRDEDADRQQWARDWGVDVAAYACRGFPKQRIARRTGPDVDPACPQHGALARPGECSCPGHQPTWTVVGFWDYAVYMALPQFIAGLADLASQVPDRRIAIMCQEGRWFSCHRSMIADAMWALHHVDSRHLPSRSKTHSQMLGNRLLRYPSVCWDAWGQDPPTAE